MSESKELMTNRELSHLCGMGLCEWLDEKQNVHNSYKYSCKNTDSPVSEQILIRPFDKIPFTNANKNEWYTPTKESYLSIISGEKTRRVLGF